MREIKFRAWDEGREKMWYRDSISGDSNDIRFVFYKGGIQWGVYDNHLESRLVTGDPKAIFNFPGILMQYTGLKDKNGKDIYEGDIVDHHTSRYTIGWNEQMGCWENFDGDEGQLLGNGHDFFEVIGNIYENAHLLVK